MTTHADDRGTSIKEGDFVSVLYVDRGRGAEQWMGKGQVIGFSRVERVWVKFPSRTKPQSVGCECLRVVPA